MNWLVFESPWSGRYFVKNEKTMERSVRERPGCLRVISDEAYQKLKKSGDDVAAKEAAFKAAERELERAMKRAYEGGGKYEPN